jgi:phage shock protein E
VELPRFEIAKWSKRILPVVLGAACGYAYYHYVGCASGTCPLTSNPYVTTVYGSVVGAMFIPRTKGREQKEERR